MMSTLLIAVAKRDAPDVDETTSAPAAQVLSNIDRKEHQENATVVHSISSPSVHRPHSGGVYVRAKSWGKRTRRRIDVNPARRRHSTFDSLVSPDRWLHI
ncbi:hypothetical protein AB4Z17_29490 [Paenibacillus sp. TAF43_2]